jgi:tripartite-type tricarboxylate transporter receptor subunit TctC
MHTKSIGRRAVARRLGRAAAALGFVAAQLTGWGALQSAAAQPAWPAATVKLVVGFPPGGGADNVARILAVQLAKTLGQSFVVENRPGANGRIGADFVVRSKPDGSTLLISPEGAIVIGPHIAANIPYHPLTDLAPVSLLTTTATMLVATPSLPVNSVAELIKLAKEKPGTIYFGSSGVGGPNHLAGEVFKHLTGIDIVHVPYNGTGAVIPAVMSGEVGLMFGFIPGLVPYVKSHAVKALAVGGATRSPALPDVPTMAEAGVPGYDMTSWVGAFAPSGTPQPIVDRIQAAIAAAIADPQVHARLVAEGLDPVADTPAAFAAFLQKEDKKYIALLKPLNIHE